MDNFDHEENTKSGTEESNDSILMLFQNGKNNVEKWRQPNKCKM